MRWLKRRLARKWLALIPLDELAKYVKDEKIRQSFEKMHADLAKKMLENFTVNSNQINLSGYEMSCLCSSSPVPHNHKAAEFKSDKHLTDIRKK